MSVQVTRTAQASWPDVDGETFAALGQQAKGACPMSRALAGTEISLEAQLARH